MSCFCLGKSCQSYIFRCWLAVSFIANKVSFDPELLVSECTLGNKSLAEGYRNNADTFQTKVGQGHSPLVLPCQLFFPSHFLRNSLPARHEWSMHWGNETLPISATQNTSALLRLGLTKMTSFHLEAYLKALSQNIGTYSVVGG